MLARITAGTTLKPHTPGGGNNNHVNVVMAALGMGSAGLWGSSILLANYADDLEARKLAIELANRWAWLTWLKVGRPEQAVTTKQMKRLAYLAVKYHCNPAAYRQATIKNIAADVGVNHHTFRVKYRKHFHRIQAELQAREAQAIAAINFHL